MDIRLSMYTVNALMHQSMSPVELYDMNSPQMEELLSYYFNSLNRLENAQPETRCSREIQIAGDKAVQQGEKQGCPPLLAHLHGVTSVTS